MAGAVSSATAAAVLALRRTGSSPGRAGSAPAFRCAQAGGGPGTVGLLGTEQKEMLSASEQAWARSPPNAPICQVHPGREWDEEANGTHPAVTYLWKIRGAI